MIVEGYSRNLDRLRRYTSELAWMSLDPLYAYKGRDIELCMLTVGYSRSGSSLLGQLLNAHQMRFMRNDHFGMRIEKLAQQRASATQVPDRQQAPFYVPPLVCVQRVQRHPGKLGRVAAQSVEVSRTGVTPISWIVDGSQLCRFGCRV